jgi:hypothetical protein
MFLCRTCRCPSSSERHCSVLSSLQPSGSLWGLTQLAWIHHKHWKMSRIVGVIRRFAVQTQPAAAQQVAESLLLMTRLQLQLPACCQHLTPQQTARAIAQLLLRTAAVHVQTR